MSAETSAATAPRGTRPFYWSVRRELWENRAVHIAPLIAGGVVLLGVLISVVHPLHVGPGVRTSGPHAGGHAIMPPEAPYAFAAFVAYVTAFVVGIFYSLGALHGERRDRSILFWKSLPVSDATAVFAKAFVPLVILPLITFVVTAATQIVIFVIGAAASAVHGSPSDWVQVPLAQILGSELYQMVATIPWYAPLWAWLLMVSAWARKMTFLWGAGPPLAACVVEQLAFGTSHLWTLLLHRLGDVSSEAFDLPSHNVHGIDMTPQMDPIKFLSSPDLWIGLAFAAVFLTAAVWLRRRQEPI
jgi:ABC-2 type transport system permease protein